MGSFGVTLCLLILVTLTSTWASSWMNRDDANESESQERYERKMENHIRRYFKNEAKRLERNSEKFGRKIRRSLQGNEEKESVPYSTKRFEKMLEKAIVKIITGDLSTADMMLLKSLNYSLEEVLAIRERELDKKIKESEVPEVLKVGETFEAKKIDEEIMKSEQSLTESSKATEKQLEDNKDSERRMKNSFTVSPSKSSKKMKKNHKKYEEDIDFDSYNKQAVYDYENVANKMSQQSELDPVSSIVDHEDRSVKEIKQVFKVEDDVRTNFDRAMEPHVVFKIRYDDSEFDSNSDERGRQLSIESGGSSLILKNDNENLLNSHESRKKNVTSLSSKASSWSPSKFSSFGMNTTPGNHEDKTFQSSTRVDVSSSLPVVYRLGNFLTPREDTNVMTTEKSEILKNFFKHLDSRMKDKSVESVKSIIDEKSSSILKTDNVRVDLLVKNENPDDFKKSNMYEGLEWVEDDVYRVIPEVIDALNYDSNSNDVENDTIDDSDGNGNNATDLDSRMFYDERNDTASYQNENPEDDDNQSTLILTNSSISLPMKSSLTNYQQLAMAHRRDQSQKAIEDIKLKVLAMTGRFNLTSSSNQVQRERLTMFSPICQAPRNTDLETWSDPFSMNMNFQLNLTSDDHVVAAKMRIYRLPQINVTVSSNAAAIDEEDEEEKKIRISIYFYTKSLKKHRSKKRLTDSLVTALKSQGSHLALDVRPALRFWRHNLRNSSYVNNNNHGLVIQLEDQDGRPLKPSQYIQQDSCHTSEQNEDDKAYQRIPALFVQACSRYVRVVNGETVTYVNCRKSLRNDRH